MRVGEVPKKLIHTCIKSTFALLCALAWNLAKLFFRIQIFMWLMGFRNRCWSAVFPATT